MQLFSGDFRRECAIAFLHATTEMLQAAKILMPFPDVRRGESVEEYRDRVTPDEFINYTLFHEIKDVVESRVVPHDLLQQTALEIEGDHFEKNQDMYARNKWDRGVTPVFVRAAAMSHVAYDITAVLGSGDPEIGSDMKRAELSWNFLAIANQCAVPYLSRVGLCLQAPKSVAMGINDPAPVAA